MMAIPSSSSRYLLWLGTVAICLLHCIPVQSQQLSYQWQSKSSYSAGVGRHHPITFANETHGFVLGGTTENSREANDFYIYDEATDSWTDISPSAAPFPPRSFGYGIVLNERNHPKAYLGFGASTVGGFGDRLNDLWELDMSTLQWKQLASCPGLGRRHPSMVPVYDSIEKRWYIHVGLGDGWIDTGNRFEFSNFNDYWSYDIDSDAWTQLPDFPSSKRHHPFFFGIGDVSYTGLGHSDGDQPYIERDFYSYSVSDQAWTRDADFASYQLFGDSAAGATRPTPQLETTEARVAGTEFSIVLPLVGDSSPNATDGLSGAIGFVLSGDGDDHGGMEEGEFHAFYPSTNIDGITWGKLPPHPGRSRWAPGSFVMRGTARAYFTSGYDRETSSLLSDVWMIDLSWLFGGTSGTVVDDIAQADTEVVDEINVADKGWAIIPRQVVVSSMALSMACILS